MPFPEDALDDDEELLVHEHPHGRVLLRPVAVLLGVAAAGGFLAAVVRGQSWHGPAWLALGVLGAVVLARWTAWPALVRLRTHLVVTDRRVLVRDGVLRRAVVDVPLRAVSGVAYRDGVLDRALRTGTLVVEAVGRTPLELADVPRVARVHAALHHAALAEDGPLGGDDLDDLDDLDERDARPGDRRAGRG